MAGCNTLNEKSFFEKRRVNFFFSNPTGVQERRTNRTENWGVKWKTYTEKKYGGGLCRCLRSEVTFNPTIVEKVLKIFSHSFK